MGPGIHVDPTRTRDIAEELDGGSGGRSQLTAVDRQPVARDSWQPSVGSSTGGRSPAEAASQASSSLSFEPACSCGLDRLMRRWKMQKADKERVVAELTERLRASETLIVADYRGLTMPPDRRAPRAS